MAGENAKVHFPQGADKMRVESGGSIELERGSTDVSITSNGTNILITGLPTSDPGVAGALYTNSLVLTLSAGGG